MMWDHPVHWNYRTKRSGPSPDPSPEGKGSNHRDTPYKKDIGFVLSRISIYDSFNVL